MCPLCGEDYDTRLHLLGKSIALVEKGRKEMFVPRIINTGVL